MTKDCGYDSTETSDDEATLLSTNDAEENKDIKTFSKAKELLILLMLLSIQFLALCSDTIIYPFFPAVAYNRGVSNTQIGVVFASYDFARFIASPIFGTLVSLITSI